MGQVSGDAMEGGLRRLRIFICGAHSTGKTTLHRQLAERLPDVYAQNELARQVISDMGLTIVISRCL